MPEGPEIQWCATFYKKYLQNSIITNIIDCNNNQTTQLNETVFNVECKGKLLWIQLNNIFIHIHFGLSGWIQTNNSYGTKYRICINNKSDLLLTDTGANSLLKLNIYSKNEHIEKLNKIGISIFSNEFTLSFFTNSFNKRKCMLAPFLLEQHTFSGIGNYIKNEVIYMGNLKVKIKLNELNNNNINMMYNNILYVAYSKYITQIIESESTINNDEFKLLPKYTTTPYTYNIYKRKITNDGNNVCKIKVSGRDSYTINELL